MRRLGIFLVTWGVLAMGGAVVACGTQGVRIARDSATEWRAVDGEVLQVVEASRRSGRVSVPTLSVTARARLAGREVVGRFDAPPRQRARFARGATVQVFVDAESADRLVLEPPTTGLLVAHAVGIPLAFALGLGSILAGRKLTRRDAERRAKRDSRPEGAT